jgi:hypothetical protein
MDLGIDINEDLEYIVCGVMDWIHLAQGDLWRVFVNAVLKLGVP